MCEENNLAKQSTLSLKFSVSNQTTDTLVYVTPSTDNDMSN